MNQLKDAVVAAYGRSPCCRGGKGSLALTHPVDFGAEVLQGVLSRVPQLLPEEIEDVIVGCAHPQGAQSNNMARLIMTRAGLPDCVSAQTVNRFCASGLQSIATAANAICCGQAEVMVAGGVESMSMVPMYDDDPGILDGWLLKNHPSAYMTMGLTAENVAERYQISRREMEEMSVESHHRAAAAQSRGEFDDQIVPVTAMGADGLTVVVTKDEGIRPDANMESLKSLKTPFREDGRVTAATSSPITDGAAFLVLMSGERARQLGISPLARFIGYATGGVPAEVMGIGPTAAVPKVLKKTGLSVDELDIIELNEAFASQALVCIRSLGLAPEKVNPMGGALALGHPLGATGAILTCKALSYLGRTQGRYAMVTMCIGGGMGAAGIFERLGK